MRACRRDTFDDSNTILLAAVRPSEQLPWIGWRLPSAASNQAPSSWDAFTQKRSTKKSWWTQSVSFEGASSCEPARIRRGVGGASPCRFRLPSNLNNVYSVKVTNE